jgi:hypothetical protein
MKYTVEMTSGCMIDLPSLITIGSRSSNIKAITAITERL